MPVLIILGISLIWIISEIYEQATRNNHVFTDEELHEILRKTTGKSKKEARKIFNSYKKRY